MGNFTSLEDTLSHLAGARRIAIGGMLLENAPSALVRALISTGVNGVHLTSGPASSWDADVLAASRTVECIRIPHVSLGSLGLAPALRVAVESGVVAVEECEEAILLGGLLAAAGRAQFQPLEHLGRNEVVDGNPLVGERGGMPGVRPAEIDVALLHAPFADEMGNLVHIGSRWADLLLARCAQRVIVQVEARISVKEATRRGVSIPGYLTHDIVVIPHGAHPLGSVGLYTADRTHLAEYARAVKSGRAQAYVDKYCLADPAAYADLIGANRFAALTIGAA